MRSPRLRTGSPAAPRSQYGDAPWRIAEGARRLHTYARKVTPPRRNLLLATGALLLCFTAWGLLSPLAKRFQADLDLSSTQTAVLIALPVLLGSLLRIPLGALSDRHGGRRTFAALLAAAALPATMVGFAQSYPMLLLAAFLLGLAGSSFAVGAPFVARWTPHERHGLALGLYALGGAGTALAAFVVPPVVTSWGRPALGVLMALVLLAGAAAFWRFAEDPPAPARRADYRRVLGAGARIYRLAFLYFVAFGAIVSMTLFLPKLLGDWYDLSLTAAAVRAAGFTLVALTARLGGGLASDRVGAYRVLVPGFAVVVLDAALLAELGGKTGETALAAICLSLAAALGLCAGAIFKLVPREFPTSTGAAVGVVGAAGGLGGFFPPLLLGIAQDALHGTGAAFAGLLVFALLAVAVAARAAMRAAH